MNITYVYLNLKESDYTITCLNKKTTCNVGML